MRKMELLHFKGKEIYYFNFSNLRNEQEIFEIIVENNIYIHNQLPKSMIILINVENLHFNDQIKGMVTDFIKENKNYAKANAIIGINGFKQSVYFKKMRFSDGHIRTFDSAELAKKWLVSLP
jgi:hypothetical protein